MSLISDMSWFEVKDYLKKDNRIILPLGAIEEHGRHLGLGTDCFEAEAIATAVGEATGVAVAPTLNYGMSLPQMGFPGTISLQPTTLIAILIDLFRSFYHNGFRRVLVVNGHGGNNASISNAVQSFAVDYKEMQFKMFQWWTDAEAYKVVIDLLGEQYGSHASLAETSFMLAVRPGAVNLMRLTGQDAPMKESREIITIRTFAQHYPDGIMGLDPRKANREAGEALLRKFVEICTRELDTWSE